MLDVVHVSIRFLSAKYQRSMNWTSPKLIVLSSRYRQQPKQIVSEAGVFNPIVVTFTTHCLIFVMLDHWWKRRYRPGVQGSQFYFETDCQVSRTVPVVPLIPVVYPKHNGDGFTLPQIEPVWVASPDRL